MIVCSKVDFLLTTAARIFSIAPRKMPRYEEKK